MRQKSFSQRISLPLVLLFGFLFIAAAVAAERDPWLRPEVAPAPPENQLNPARINLGQLLFFDPRLSRKMTMSCASCQAAHAGEHGRGFAVVAAEVRSLSQRCTASAREIKQLIEVSNATVRHGTTLVASAGKTIEDVVERVATMADVVGEIARDAQEQCVGIESVARKIAEVETNNSENANLLAQARESAHELQMLAGELGGAVGRFRIDADAPAGSASTSAAALSPPACRATGSSLKDG